MNETFVEIIGNVCIPFVLIYFVSMGLSSTIIAARSVFGDYKPEDGEKTGVVLFLVSIPVFVAGIFIGVGVL